MLVEMARSPDTLAGRATMNFARCPIDIEAVAESYCLGQLDPAVAKAFEDHYLVCAECARALAEMSDFVDAFRIAAQAS